jgi:DHA2 family multidrug resistance protein-like MFS transporter
MHTMSPRNLPASGFTDGLPNPERLWAFLAIAIALTIAVLDSAIVNVALPVLAQELQVDPATAVWAVNAYQLAITVSLLPLASLGDALSYRRIYWAGLLVFTLASFGCAFAGSFPVLIVARVLQGLGAAGIMSVNIALVRFIYPAKLLGRGVGNTALVVAVSSAAGPTLAAAILSVASWPWLFLINVPLGVFALIVAARSRRGRVCVRPLPAIAADAAAAPGSAAAAGVCPVDDDVGLLVRHTSARLSGAPLLLS